MNLTKLFETQKVLRDRIGYNEPDRFNKLILALLVEIGECANEWRGFKFWSVDQEPRVKKERKQLRKGSELLVNYEDVFEWVPYNPLLEEYVDGLHFVLELGMELPTNFSYYHLIGNAPKTNTIEEKFLDVFSFAQKFRFKPTNLYYSLLLEHYITLGEMLGFTWEQIEEAYYKKNQINHDRQDSGY